MKLCIPVASAEGLSAPLHADFGGARYLLIIDGEVVHSVDRERPELISEEIVSGIQGVLCSEIHPRLLFELQHNGIQVYGCEAASAGEALAMFQAGELELAPPFNPGDEQSGGCCGGHGGADGEHECCGGKGHDNPDHECCGGKGHAQEHGHGRGGCCGGH